MICMWTRLRMKFVDTHARLEGSCSCWGPRLQETHHVTVEIAGARDADQPGPNPAWQYIEMHLAELTQLESEPQGPFLQKGEDVLARSHVPAELLSFGLCRMKFVKEIERQLRLKQSAAAPSQKKNFAILDLNTKASAR